MTELALSLATGVVLGLAYLSILWRSVRHLPTASAPTARLVMGIMLRLGLAAAVVAFALHLGVGAPAILAGLLGFSLVRSAVAARVGRAPRTARG